jgi:23S rRNA (uracil1939-C5)-methyltransferase
MNKNDIITLKIEDMGIDGEGIGKIDGMTFFVKDAVIGDEIEARITKLKKNYGYARVEQILKSSEFRTEPKCELHRRCGCQIQAMDYAKQLEFKENKVKNNLVRLGGFDADFVDSVTEPIVGMENPYRYRNKAQFPIGKDKDGNIIAGFYASRTHSIIPVKDCMLGVAENREILDAILSYMRECHIEPYDETTGRGLVRHALIRYGFTTKEIMVCLVVNGRKLPAQNVLVEKLQAIPGVTSISMNINQKNTNVILGEQTETIWGQPYITDYIHLRDCTNFERTGKAISYHISPQSFYQVNPEQTEKLYSLALEYAGLTGKESVWDLYCGIGTISLFLAGKAGHVYGVEIVPQAIADAKDNAKRNGFSNTEFFVGKAEEVLPEFYAKHKNEKTDMLHPDVIVVDPPRKGCDEKCLETMLLMKPERIVYVSCDSATLARDLKVLAEGGYEVKRVRAVDQFAHTTHVETVVLLSKGMVDTRKVKVDFSLEDMDLSEFRGKATYEQIKAYVLEQTGLKVSSLYIAQIKKKCGLDVGENFNLAKSENARQPQCTPEKEDAIMLAFRHFGII